MKDLEILNPQSLGIIKTIFDNKTPILFIMQGLPGSGKSTIAKSISEEIDNTIIHSSDDLRKELFGDETNQEKNNELFAELHKRIISDLEHGKNVIYDATNISKKNRISFLKEIKQVKCSPVNILVMTPFNVCLQRDKERDRVVGKSVIKRMYESWQPPHYSEGFSKIIPIFCDDYDYANNYNLDILIDKMMVFDQENSHHALSLGEHCIKAYKYVESIHPENTSLRIAALLHDIGKLYTKTHYNKRGEYDTECHYYNHNCVSAYESIFYLWNYIDDTAKDINETVYIANLIYYHMHPYLSWKSSEKSLNKDVALIGAKMFRDICYLHDADLFAH